jgi:hypothetical protein
MLKYKTSHLNVFLWVLNAKFASKAQNSHLKKYLNFGLFIEIIHYSDIANIYYDVWAEKWLLDKL